MPSEPVPGRTKRRSVRRAAPPAVAPGVAAAPAWAEIAGGVVRIGVPTGPSAGTAAPFGPPTPAARGPNGAAGFSRDRGGIRRSFAERSRARTGEAPSDRAAPYASVRHRLRAVEATGGVSGEATTQAMKTARAERFGRTATVHEDGRVLYNLALYGAKSPKESRGVWGGDRPVAQTPAAGAFRPLADGGSMAGKT